MINNDQSALLYCCEDVKSHRSGGDTVPLNTAHKTEDRSRLYHIVEDGFPTTVTIKWKRGFIGLRIPNLNVSKSLKLNKKGLKVPEFVLL